MSSPDVPTNVTRIVVAGYFTDSNDVATAGKLVVTPDFTRGINDAWRRIVMAAPTSMEPSAATGLAYVSVVAGDDPDLNPSNFTHTVSEPGGRKYQIFVSQDTPVWTAGTPGHPLEGQRVLWLNSVAPSDAPSSGVVQVVAGPQGPPGEVSAAQLSAAVAAAKLADRPDLDTTGAAVGQIPAVTQASGGAATAFGLASPVSIGARSRRVWSIGDSLTAGNLTVDAVMVGIGQGGIQYQPGSWQTWALLASGARWTHGGAFATGGYTAAQILATHVPAVLAASQPGDTVVVLAGTNGNVLADAQAIHAALRAAGRHTVACTIPPSTASTLSAIAAFNSGLKSWAGANGVPLADVHAAVVDTVTGAYQTALNGDGVHPSEAGYRQFGYTIAATLAQVFPLAQADLVAHNAAFTGQLQPKPLALNSPTVGTDYNNLAPLGTSTFAPAANTAFVGGQGYKIVRGDTDVNARLANMTLVEGHRMRVGMAVEVVAGTTPTWSMRLESATTGQKALWGIGFPTAATYGQGASRFYSTFTVPTLPDYSYRLRIFATGVGTTLHVGEVTMLDLTAMGLA